MIATADTMPPEDTPAKLPPPPESLAQFLQAIFDPKDLVLIRFIETWTEGSRKKSRTLFKETTHVAASWLDRNPKLWGRILRLGTEERVNIFFGVCPRFSNHGGFDLAWQIRVVRVLWSDIDHCTPEEALRRCEAKGLPAPTVVVRSGNGVHLYWLLAEPYRIDDVGAPPPVKKRFVKNGDKKKCLKFITDPETKQEVLENDFPKVSPKGQHIQDTLAGIAAQIGGDYTTDLSRLLRLPCTLNRKDERNGRTPILCEVVACDPSRRYPLADFERFAEQAPRKVRQTEAAKIRMPRQQKLTVNRLNKLNDFINVCNITTAGERSEPDYALCCWAIRQGLDKEELWQNVASVGKFGERGRDYFDLTWENAENEVRGELYEKACMRAGMKAVVGDGTVATNGHTNGTHAVYGGTAEASPPALADPSGLPTIQGNRRQLRHITDDGLRAILNRNKPPTVFQRGELLTRQRQRHEHGEVVPYLEPMTEAAIRGLLGRVANWKKLVRTKEGDVEEECPPQMDVVKDLAALPAWDGIPVIDTVVECPVFTCDGRLIESPGYHESARLWYRPTAGLEVPPVSANPTRAEVDQAKALLLVELFGDFPFRDDASKAHALATLLLPFVRQMIDGPTPLHLFDAPVEGTGKGLLITCISFPSTGRHPAVMTEGSCDEEWRKRITALLAEAPIYILLDNLNRILDSGAVAGALTARTWKDRILGVSKTASFPNTAVWVASGNNTKLSREIIRRTLWCRIDAKVDAPWERTEFRHPNLAIWAKENRGKLVWAALTLCQAWIAAGKPAGKQTLGAFESWAEVVGGILGIIEVPGLLANAKYFRKAAADKADEWRAFVMAWWHKHERASVGVQELYQLATEQALLDSVLGDKEPKSQRTRLGIQMGKVRDRVYGEYRIEASGEDHSGRNLYRLCSVVGAQPAVAPTATPAQADEVTEWSA